MLSRLLDWLVSARQAVRSWRIRWLCRRIDRLYRRVVRLRGDSDFHVNVQVYYEVQRHADTAKQHISAADTSRVLRVFRDYLREQHQLRGFAAVMEIVVSMLED